VDVLERRKRYLPIANRTNEKRAAHRRRLEHPKMSGAILVRIVRCLRTATRRERPCSTPTAAGPGWPRRRFTPWLSGCAIPWPLVQAGGLRHDGASLGFPPRPTHGHSAAPAKKAATKKAVKRTLMTSRT
jgi:hypothetical protein